MLFRRGKELYVCISLIVCHLLTLKVQSLGTIYLSDEDDDTIIILTSDSDYDAEFEDFAQVVRKGKERAEKHAISCSTSPEGSSKKAKF